MWRAKFLRSCLPDCEFGAKEKCVHASGCFGNASRPRFRHSRIPCTITEKQPRPPPNKTPVVAPPPGSDIYMVARLWSFWPILELEKDKTYRLHLTSMDYNHGFSLQPANINIQIVPGYEHVVTVTPNRAGTYSVICNEYCGINHSSMVGRIYVK